MQSLSLWSFFTDPVLRGPTLGSMFMCLAAGLTGVIVFLRRQSLVGETLSHAAYPGVILGVLLLSLWESICSFCVSAPLWMMLGGLATILLAAAALPLLRSLKVPADAALCFTLSAFFGVGVLLASFVQFSQSGLYRQVEAYLYGQAATMGDFHILLYGVLSLITMLGIALFYKELLATTFDRDFSKSAGLSVRLIDLFTLFWLALAVAIGIRSVGVVLMSAMLIAPAAAARQYTQKLGTMFALAGLFGLLSGLVGNYLSVSLGVWLKAQASDIARLSLPTGPMIILVASGICALSLLFAPERGLLWRVVRIYHFRQRCAEENLLKALWRHGPYRAASIDEIAFRLGFSKFKTTRLLHHLKRNGWITSEPSGRYLLTSDGVHRAAKIVRLHRLWEVYLADYLGVGAERVHHSAEEMEHILTPELEKELTLLLKDPKRDPHSQPIPTLGGD